MINNEYPPLGGGQASANKSIMNVLQSADYKISSDIITSSVGEFKIEKTQIGEIFYLNIGKKNKNLQSQNAKDLITFSIKSFLYAKKLIRKQPYDLIIAWAGIPSGFVAYWLNKICKIQYIALFSGPSPTIQNSIFCFSRFPIARITMSKPLILLILPTERMIVFPKSDNCFCVSLFQKLKSTPFSTTEIN